MFKKFSILFIIFSLFVPQKASATDASSPYLPEIQSLAWSGLSYFDGDGSKSGASQTRIDLTVRVHRNSITRIGITWTSGDNSYKPGPLEPPCSTQLDLLAGERAPGLDSPILNLVSREKDGDWFIEKYQVVAATYLFTFPLCPTTFQVAYISLYDELARYLEVDSIGQLGSIWGSLPKDSPFVPCPLKAKSNPRQRDVWVNCNHKIDWSSLSFRIDRSAGLKTVMPEVVNYAAELSELRSEFRNLNSTASGLSSKVTALEAESIQIKGQLSAAASEKSQLQSQIDKLSQENSKLNEQVTAFLNQGLSLQKRLAKICKTRPKPKGC